MVTKVKTIKKTKEKEEKVTRKTSKTVKTKEQKATVKGLKQKEKNINENLNAEENKETKEVRNIPPNENNPDEEIARKVIEGDLKEAVKTKDLKKLTTEPENMEQLIEETGYELRGLKKGQKVVATITDKNKRTVFFDIGAKTEGILIDKEVEYVKDYVNFLNVGDSVVCTVVSPENDKGQILLSLRRSATKWKWDLFERYMESNTPIEVRGLDINRGGMIARVLNVHGFIPVSQFGRQWSGKLDQLYNKVFPVKIIEVDREKNRLIFSERAISESDILQKQKEILGNVKPGDRYEGEVSGVMPFGIFVRVFVEGADNKEVFLDGLVHISEISWEKVTDVSKLYNVGDKINVQVIDSKGSDGKLNLSIKRIKDNPWEKLAEEMPVDTKAKGKITRLAPYGAFVSLKTGIEGLIHVSKIPSDVELKVGQEVNIYIESIDVDNHRISLGMSLSAKPVGYK